jgi:peptidoglycan lytic transglycosylase G
MRVLLVLAALIALLAGGMFGAAWWEEKNFSAEGPLNSEKIFIVEQGESLRGIAEDLEREGIVADAFLFRIGVMRRRASASLQAGEYAFSARTSMADAMALIVSGKVVEHRITVAEGVTSEAAMEIVMADPVLTGEAGPVPPEGSLLPETYMFRRGTTRAEMLARMRKAQETLLAELWPKRKGGLPLASPEDAIKLASIVEKETGLASERPRIAAIFVNRLKTGMKLESDPTIIYGLTKGVPLGHPLRQSELAKENPYSTYQIAGLPPTPICNPGREAIAAVLNPPDSEEFYFVADGSGGHAFARTGGEHARNVTKLRQLERAQVK